LEEKVYALQSNLTIKEIGVKLLLENVTSPYRQIQSLRVHMSLTKNIQPVNNFFSIPVPCLEYKKISSLDLFV
jgi:hypothetical protein